MTQRIRRRQCGCVNDCFGRDIIPLEETLASMIEQNKACCSECEGSAAPCVYTVEAACDFSVKYAGDPIPKKIIYKSFSGPFGYSMFLRKYCIGGCEYRAGTIYTKTLDEAKFFEGFIPGEAFAFPRLITDPNLPGSGKLFQDPVFDNLCTIAENWWFPSELGYPYTAEEYQALIDRSTTWILRPIPNSGGHWELAYVYPDAEGVTLSFPHTTEVSSPPLKVGRSFRYVSVSPWKCLESNTVMLDDASQLIYPTAPKYLCVIPKPTLSTDIGGDIAHLCKTVLDQCNCCDNGMCTGYAYFELDCPGGLYEFPPFETKRYLPTDRYDAVGGEFPLRKSVAECRTGQPPVPAEIEELVPDVDSVPCGIFYGTFAGGGVVWWCDGTEYNMVLWCINPITEEATVIYNGAPSEFECRCDWYYFKLFFETPPACLQCPGVDPPIETECCAEPTPASLDVEVVAFTGGGEFQPGCEACLGAGNYPAPLSGTTININYDSGTEIWDGSLSVCGVTLRATLECNNPGFANPFLLRLYVNGVEINNAALGTGGTFTCSPFYGETSSMVFSSMSDCVSLIATVSEAS